MYGYNSILPCELSLITAIHISDYGSVAVVILANAFVYVVHLPDSVAVFQSAGSGATSAVVPVVHIVVSVGGLVTPF